MTTTIKGRVEEWWNWNIVNKSLWHRLSANHISSSSESIMNCQHTHIHKLFCIYTHLFAVVAVLLYDVCITTNKWIGDYNWGGEFSLLSSMAPPIWRKNVERSKLKIALAFKVKNMYVSSLLGHYWFLKR